MDEPTTPRRRFFQSLAGLATLVIAPLGWAASPAVLDITHAAVRAVMAVQADVTASWMQSPAILGTAVGVDDASQAVLLVYVDRNHSGMSEAIRALPLQVRGVGVRVETTDKFRAMVGKPGGGSGHTAKLSPPIQLGTSGGWKKDLANGYCCGGTLGSLVTYGGVQYILSNYHVFESDTVLGGNQIVAKDGDPIIQPGLIDVGCNAASAQDVATLKTLHALFDGSTNNVDCSVAQVNSGMVSGNGSILEVGTISSTTATAFVGQPVKKSGRTTGLTRSKVSGLNATVRVTYDNECAGGTAFTITYTGQIVISNTGSKFLNSGDSGSLMVEDVNLNPHAVGLLFAGSSTSAIANPIDEVLSFVSKALGGGAATMVGAP